MRGGTPNAPTPNADAQPRPTPGTAARPRPRPEGELVVIRHPARGEFRAVVELQRREARRVH